MFKVIWDDETRGILLADTVLEEDTINPPRPVYYEELDLLGLNKYLNYPKVNEPLLWAIDRRYFYNGKLVAEAKGGNVLEKPEIKIVNEGEKLEIKPIDVSSMIEKNKDSLFILENEAIDFVKSVFNKYKQGIDSFVVAFSGGKDSQVVLDIVSRVIPPDEYMVVFTDTNMEIPQTYKTVEHTKEFYQNKYPKLRFEVANHEQTALELWQKFGPPSRIHRWCCSVFKTSLFGRKMRSFLNKENQIKVVVFEGVRADESSRREKYNRIGDGVKHMNIINSRIILNWNTTEVFLYMLSRNIKINSGYRLGLNRIGCSICPFASDWSEYIIGEKFPHLTEEYLNIIRNMASNIGIKNDRKINDYIKKGNWKKKSGGKGLDFDDSRLDIIIREPDFEAVLSHPKQSILEWLQVVGTINYKKYENRILGELKFKDEIFKFELSESKEVNKFIFKLFNTYRKFDLQRKLVRALNKSVFCESCGACEIECPTSALRIIPDVNVDSYSCINCHKCLTFCEKGCLVAQTRKVSEGGSNMQTKTSAIDKYSSFGMRRHWVMSFFAEMDNWFSSKHGLGPRQVPAMINWLREAELLNSKDKTVTYLAKLLSSRILKDESFVWEIIWTNLYFNSTIIKWYVNNIEFNTTYTKNELFDMLKSEFSHLSDGTLNNPLTALFNMFEESSLGDKLKLGVVEKKGRIRTVTKVGTNEVSIATIAYFLYKTANEKNIYEFTVSDFYNNDLIGPYELFGVSKQRFENILRVLQENPNEIVKVDLAADLDNIHLRDDLSYVDALKILL